MWPDRATFPPRAAGPGEAPGGWILSGGPWTFGSDALWAPYTNLGCMANDGDGPYLVGAQVPRDQLRFLDDWQVAGMRATGSVSLTLPEDELFVPEHRCVDFRDVVGMTLDTGLKGSVWKAPSLGWAFSLMAGMSVGLAEGALERFLERSKGRPIRGTTYKNQLEAPLTHLMLAEVLLEDPIGKGDDRRQRRRDRPAGRPRGRGHTRRPRAT